MNQCLTACRAETPNFPKKVYRLSGLWTKKDIGTTEKTLNRIVPGHDVLMLRLSKM